RQGLAPPRRQRRSNRLESTTAAERRQPQSVPRRPLARAGPPPVATAAPIHALRQFHRYSSSEQIHSPPDGHPVRQVRPRTVAPPSVRRGDASSASSQRPRCRIVQEFEHRSLLAFSQPPNARGPLHRVVRDRMLRKQPNQPYPFGDDGIV